MSTSALVALLTLLLVVTAAATVALVTLLVVVVVQAFRDRRLDRALVTSQQHGAVPGGTPTAPVGLIGRMEAWTTGSIPTVEGLRALQAAARDTPEVTHSQETRTE